MADGSHPPVKRRPGRPSSYDPDIAQAICHRMIGGESLRAICESDKMPDKATVLRWAHDNEEFRDQYARAIWLAGDSDADDVSHYSHAAARGEIEPAAATAAINGLKWSAGKRNPKRYGDKVLHAGADGGALQIEQKRTLDISLYSPEERETLRVLLELGRQRQLALESGQVIEGECREVEGE